MGLGGGHFILVDFILFHSLSSSKKIQIFLQLKNKLPKVSTKMFTRQSTNQNHKFQLNCE